MSSRTRLSVESLNVKTNGKTILDGLTFSAESEVLGVAGANGSGKTTLLKAIEAAARGKEERVSLASSSGHGKPTVGYLPQSFRLPGVMRVREFIEYACWIKSVPSIGESTTAAIREAQLEPFQNLRLNRVSGGVAQRTGFASILVDDPEILLLDEPTTAVDIEQREVMRELIASQSRGRVTLISSHIVEDLEKLCDRILVLNKGQLTFIGSAAQACEVTGQGTFSEALVALSASPQ